MPERSLPQLIEHARMVQKPILIYFVAQPGTYRGNHRQLDLRFRHPSVVKSIADNFLFRIYCRGVGQGTAAAAALGVNTFDPVLLVLTSEGDIVRRWVVEWTAQLPTSGDFAVSLALWAREARVSTPTVIERAGTANIDVGVLIEAAERSWVLQDLTQTKQFLHRISETTLAESPALSARAAWQMVLVESTEKMRQKWQQLAKSYLRAHPAYGLPAVRMLAASGAPAEILDESMNAVIRAADEAGVALDLNAVAYDALEWGAYGGALTAATVQVKKFPQAPNAWDTLAAVHNARGEHQDALDAAAQGLALPNIELDQRCTLEGTRSNARSQSAGRIEYTCQRRLGRGFIRVPGEDQLFLSEFPSAAVRRTFIPALTALVHKIAGDEQQVVVLRVRLASLGEPIELDVLSSSLTKEQSDRLREAAAAQLKSPFPASGVEFIATISAES